MRLVSKLLRGTAVWVAFSLFLLALNLGVLVSAKLYDALSNALWTAVELVTPNAKRNKAFAQYAKENEALRRQMSAAEADLQREKARAAAADEELRAAKRRNAALEEKVKLEEQRARTAERKAERLSRSNSQLSQEIDGARDEATAARARATALKQELATAELESKKLEARTRSGANALQNAQTRISELDAALDGNRRKLLELEAAAGRVDRKVLAQIDEIDARLVRKTQRTIWTEGIEALPFLGTTFVLGTLALEFEDDCKLLRDMRNLGATLKGDKVGSSPELCLLSGAQLVSLFTGEDPYYERCVRDRIETGNLMPPSCTGFDEAVPEVEYIERTIPEIEGLIPKVEY